MLSDFKKFVLRGNVVDLAVAVVVGAAFTAVVTALVVDLVTPLIAAIFGKTSFSDLSFTVNHSVFKYGSFLNALISFLIIATVVFFAVVIPLTALLRLGGGAVTELLVAGDTPSDVESGLRAGAGVVAGVTTGASGADELAAAGAPYVLDSVTGLVQLLGIGAAAPR